MTHGLTCAHTGGHIYVPGGERDLDLAPFLNGNPLASTRDLPGFSFGGVTYESHHFWVHIIGRRPPINPQYVPTDRDRRPSGALIVVHHGGGWEVWEGDYLLAAALERYGDDAKGLFWLCWYMIDTARDAKAAGAREATDNIKRAFVDGRLKRRALPARGVVKVWIEPEPGKSGDSQLGVVEG